MGEKKVIRLKPTGNTLVFYCQIAYHWLQHTQARPRRGPRTKPKKKPHVQLQKHKNARTQNAERRTHTQNAYTERVRRTRTRTQNAERERRTRTQKTLKPQKVQKIAKNHKKLLDRLLDRSLR